MTFVKQQLANHLDYFLQRKYSKTPLKIRKRLNEQVKQNAISLQTDRRDYYLPNKSVHKEKSLKNPKRVVFEHEHVTAVLAIVENSYTLTNGIKSISVDEYKDWNLIADIESMHIGKIYTIGFETQMKLFHLSRKYPQLKKLSSAFLNVNETCTRRENCHRCMAVIGFQQLTNFSIEMIKH